MLHEIDAYQYCLHPGLSASVRHQRKRDEIMTEDVKFEANNEEARHAGGTKFDDGKAPLWLVPWEVLRDHIPADRAIMARALVTWVRREPGYYDWLRKSLSSADVGEAARVLTFGAEKYGAYNWEQGLRFSRVASAGLRHATSTDHLDAESKLPHRAHLACNVIFAITLEERFGESDFDDRPEAP